MAEVWVYLRPVHHHDEYLVGWRSALVLVAHVSWDDELLWHSEGRFPWVITVDD